MTAIELMRKFNTEFGMNEWPVTYEVDADTYANCCQYVFSWSYENNIREIFRHGSGDLAMVRIGIGEHKGLMFKNVELILIRGSNV